MRATVVVVGGLLAVLCASSVGAAELYVDLITPPTDDLGHYVPIAEAGSYPVMGAVATATAPESVTVAGVPAVTFPLNYQVMNAPADYGVVGFRALVFLQPTSPLRVSVTDTDGNFRDAAYLPDQEAALQRMTFWRVWRPGDSFLMLRNAVAHAAAGHYDVALPALDFFVTNYPQYGIGRHLRALTYWDMGNWSAALADLEFTVANYPEAYPPHLDLGRLLHTMADYEGAMTHYLHALGMVPTSAETHFLLGTAYRESGNLVQASFEQEAALQADPTLAPALYQQGLAEAEQGDIADAMVYMQRSVQQNPRNADAYLAMAVLRYNRGDYPRAWRALQRAEALGAVADPAFVNALYSEMSEPRRSRPAPIIRRPGP